MKANWDIFWIISRNFSETNLLLIYEKKGDETYLEFGAMCDWMFQIPRYSFNETQLRQLKEWIAKKSFQKVKAFWWKQSLVHLESKLKSKYANLTWTMNGWKLTDMNSVITLAIARTVDFSTRGLRNLAQFLRKRNEGCFIIAYLIGH